MQEAIEKKNIAIHKATGDWRGAIRAAGELLVDSGKIGERYVENMIHSVEEMGPYIVLMPGFALAHAAPCADVYENAISLITLSNPVDFHSEKGDVSVVMCLACRDNHSHMEMLQSVAEKLLEEDIVQRILDCTDVDHLYALMNA